MLVRKFENYKNSDKYSENLKYHLDNNISIVDNIFRPGSNSYFALIGEARELYDTGELTLEDIDKEFFDETDFGKFEEVDGKLIALDLPFLEELEELENEYLYEAEYKGKKVELNKPKRNSGSGKKYYVYVKDPKSGNVRKISFGDKKGGLTMKTGSASRRKAFAARHNCKDKKDKTTAGYWACRANRYKSLTSKTTKGYW